MAEKYVYISEIIKLSSRLDRKNRSDIRMSESEESHSIWFHKKRIAHKHRNANKIKPNASKYQLNISLYQQILRSLRTYDWILE